MQTFDSAFRKALVAEIERVIEYTRSNLETCPLEMVQTYRGGIAALREVITEGGLMDEAAKVIEQRNA